MQSSPGFCPGIPNIALIIWATSSPGSGPAVIHILPEAVNPICPLAPVHGSTSVNISYMSSSPPTGTVSIAVPSTGINALAIRCSTGLLSRLVTGRSFDRSHIVLAMLAFKSVASIHLNSLLVA